MAVRPETNARLTNRIYSPEAPGLASLLGLAVAVVIITALSVAREVLIPITLAVLLSFMLGPVVALLRRVRVPRGLAVMLAALVALGAVLMLGTIIGTQIASLSADMPRYASTIEEKIGLVREMATKRMAALTNGLGQMNQAQPPTPPPAAARAPATQAAPKPAGPIPVEVHNPAPGPFELLERLLLPVVSPLATAAIVFVVAIFILLQQEDLRDRIIRLFGSDDLHRTTAALDDAGKRLGRYYLSLVAVNTAFGVIIGAGLFFVGVPSPILWGIIAGLLRFVPYVGAFGGAVFPILLAAAVEPGWTMAAETVGLFLLVEPVLGQVIEPVVYGHSTGLSPVSVVISAIFWGWIWGPIGLLLSMPLTLCLVVLGKHVKRMEFLYVLLGDKPALNPAESLYQRMLVGDADEALEQAETLIKGRSLEGYYDEVAIPGLRLAANDSLRGVLTAEQLQGIMESICGVVAELAEAPTGAKLDAPDGAKLDAPAGAKPDAPAGAKPDAPGGAKPDAPGGAKPDAPGGAKPDAPGGAKPDAPGGAKPDAPGRDKPDAPAGAKSDAPVSTEDGGVVLCVSGRGPLDEAVCAMLAQVLGQHGQRARVVPPDLVRRAHAAELDLTDVRTIVISYLEGANSLFKLRYLVRRLRRQVESRHAGAIKIVVGLWAPDEELFETERIEAAANADVYVATLHDAVDACLGVTRPSTPAEAAQAA